MSPGPYLPDAEAVLALSHGHIVRARATHSTFGAELDLVDSPSSVRLSYDEQRAPRVQASLVAVLPATVAELDRLDPRTGVRVELDLGYRRPGGAEDVATIASLGLRNVAVDYQARTMTLTLASDEALVVDGSPVAVGIASGASHAACIQSLLGNAIAPPPRLDSTLTGPAVTVDPCNDRWATVADLADRLEAACYDDGTRTWYLRPVPQVASTPDATLAVGVGGTVLAPEANLARDEWFNYVQLRYSWRNASGAEQVITATAYVADGPYAITGDAGKRILLDERRVATTQAAANAAAKAVLGRQLTRSRSFTFQAIAAYWLRPGSTVRATLPGGRPELHLVSRIMFEPLAGTMTVTTRLPDTPTIATTTAAPAVPTDPSPTPSPDPAPPAKTRYVSEWRASASQAYRGNGTARTDLPDRVAQGYNPGSVNGNQSSVILFASANSTPAAGATGETGKTVAQATTGARVVRVQVELRATHWWSSLGGTMRVGWAKLASLPASWTGGQVRVNVPGWADDTSRWVDLTSTELANALTGGAPLAVTLGPGFGTSTETYALVAGATYATTAYRPRVRITYDK